MSQIQSAAPGWYFDNSTSGVERYWDGSAWTEHRRPSQTTSTTSAGSASGAAIASVVFGAVSLLTSGLYVGLILGVVAIFLGNRRGATDMLSKVGRVLGLLGAALSAIILVFALVTTLNR